MPRADGTFSENQPINTGRYVITVCRGYKKCVAGARKVERAAHKKRGKGKGGWDKLRCSVSWLCRRAEARCASSFALDFATIFP